MYIKSDKVSSQIVLPSDFQEMFVVKVKMSKSDYIISCNVYRSPNNSENDDKQNHYTTAQSPGGCTYNNDNR